MYATNFLWSSWSVFEYYKKQIHVATCSNNSDTYHA